MKHLPGMMLKRWTCAHVKYRGKDRPVIVELDRTRGMVSVRLKGCKKRRVYSVLDLWQPGQQLSFDL